MIKNERNIVENWVNAHFDLSSISHAQQIFIHKVEQIESCLIISRWTVTAYVYNTVYSESTACNPNLTRWLQHRYKQSRLDVAEHWPRQPHA